MTKEDRRDILAELRDKFVAQLQDVLDGKAERPAWTHGWDPTLGRQRNGATGHLYRGVNVWSCLLSGYSDPRWYTSYQALHAAGYRREGTGKTRKAKRTGKTTEVTRWVWKGGGEEPEWPIVKGTKGIPIVKFPVRKIEEEDKDTGEKTVRFARSRYPHYHTVFNHSQIRWPAGHEPELDEGCLLDFDPRLSIVNAKELWEAHDPKEVAGHGAAFYRPSTDEIGLPEARTFKSAERFWAVALHELVHWTGHVSRCDREGITKPSPGRATYAFEELIAEMGSATLCRILGIETDGLIHDASAYILGWIKALNDDPKKIVTAAKGAQEAIDFLLGEEPNYDSDNE